MKNKLPDPIGEYFQANFDKLLENYPDHEEWLLNLKESICPKIFGCIQLTRNIINQRVLNESEFNSQLPKDNEECLGQNIDDILNILAKTEKEENKKIKKEYKGEGENKHQEKSNLFAQLREKTRNHFSILFFAINQLKQGYISSKKENYQEAISCFEDYLFFIKNDVSIYNEMGNCFTKLNQHKKALDAYSKADKLKSNLAVVNKNMYVHTTV